LRRALNAMTVPDEGEQRLHPLTPFLDVVAMAPKLALPALLLLASTAGRVIIGAGIVLLVLRVAGYWRTWYSLGPDGLVLRSGWFQRNERVISLDRVQHVEVVRSLRHRVAGLSAVSVSVAGSGAPPVVLDAISRAEAERVQELLELGRRRSDVTAAPAAVPPPPPAPLLHLGVGVLALGGVTGAAVLVLPVFVALAWDEVSGYVDDEAAVDRVLSLGVVALAVVGLALAASVAAGLMVLRHYDFTLSRVGPDLRIDRGLLERRSSVIPLRRVQSVQLSANVLRRWVGLATIDVELATAVEHQGTGSVDNTVPVGTRAELEPLVALFAGVDVLPGVTIPHPTAARRRAVTRRALVLVLPWVAVAWPFPVVALAGSLAGAGASAIGGHRWWLHLRHGADSTVVVAESGWLVFRRTVQPWAKVQSVSLRQSPGQRSLGLCHLDLHVAASRATTRVRDVGIDQAAALLNHAPQPAMKNVLAATPQRASA